MIVDDLDDPVLAADDHHHLAKVRRVRDGDRLVLGDGAGRWVPAVMAGARPRPDGEPAFVDRRTPEVTICFGLSKGTKPEWAVQKLTEIGVDRIVPFKAERSVVRWDDRRGATASVRLARIAREAAMQSRSAWLPVVEAVQDWSDVSRRQGVCRADRHGGAPSLDRPVVLVGPEGGWSDAESSVDVPVISLGPGVLRAETAAVTAGALMCALRAGLVLPVRSR